MWLDFGVSSGKECNSSDVTRARVCTTAVKSFNFVEEVTSLQVHSLNHIAYFAGVPPIKFRRSQEWPGLLTRYQARWVIGAQHTLLRDLNYNI